MLLNLAKALWCFNNMWSLYLKISHLKSICCCMLQQYEKMNVADALLPRKFADEQLIIQQASWWAKHVGVDNLHFTIFVSMFK